MNVRSVVLVVALPLVLCACGAEREAVAPRPEPPLPDPPALWSSTSAWVESTLASMSVDERAAQVIMVTAYGHYLSDDSDEYQRLLRLVGNDRVGGVILFQGDVYEEAMMINRLQRNARIPLLVSGDFERGLAMRVRRGTYFPDPMALGATRNTGYAYQAALATAREMRAIGVHQNYAPVADVNTNPANPVINTRSFGDSPGLVASMVSAYVRGLADGGAVSSAKHFPGHGDTDLDSHLDLPLVPFSRERLDSVELKPFREAIRQGVMSVMIGHLSVPAVDDDPQVPASLSGAVMTRLLKEELGFRGLVVTDAMDMRGVSKGFSVSESSVRAFLAGADVLLMPGDDEVAIRAVLGAIRSGRIGRDRLEASVRKMLLLKQWLGLDRSRYVDTERIPLVVGTQEHRRLARKIARDAVTLLRNERGVLPLIRGRVGRVVSIVLHDTEDDLAVVHRPAYQWPMEPAGQYLHQLLRRRGVMPTVIRLTPSSTREQIDDAVARAAQADLLILPVAVRVRTSSGKVNLPGRYDALGAQLSRMRIPRIVLAMGSPYVAGAFPYADGILCGYSDAEPLVEAAIEALFGEIDVRGLLPVAIPGSYGFGSGIMSRKVCLRYDAPSAAGFDPMRLREAEDIVRAAIRDSAFPGAQLVVVKDGIVVLDEAYGTYTYESTSREVSRSSIFDLASLTKAFATTSCAMELVDEGLLSLESRAGLWVPAFADGRKSEITIRHLLTHTAGLAPFLRLTDVVSTREKALDTLLRHPLQWGPGDTTVYSDLSMIILQQIIEKVSGYPMDQYFREKFTEPLGMSSTMFNPPARVLSLVAPTEVDTVWRKSLVHGSVHDERAALLGGVAGHAGLFSSASDLAVFSQMLLDRGEYGGVRYLRDSTVARFVRRQSPRSTRALGWDTRSERGSLGGDRISMTSYGHTGFTGTMVWTDPDRRLIIVFLTNRVHPTRANARIQAVRPKLCNAIVDALLEDPSITVDTKRTER